MGNLSEPLCGVADNLLAHLKDISSENRIEDIRPAIGKWAFQGVLPHLAINTLRFSFSVCPFTDIGMTITNLRVMCIIITCASISFPRNAPVIIFLHEIVKAAECRDTLHCRLRERCHSGCLPSH